MNELNNYLEKQIEQDKMAFSFFLKSSATALQAFNIENNTDIKIFIDFKKDEWLKGKAHVKIIGEGEEEYTHSVYDDTNIHTPHSMARALMETGILTNNWFSVLDKSRSYDVSFSLSNTAIEINDENGLETREGNYYKRYSSVPSKTNKMK